MSSTKQEENVTASAIHIEDCTDNIEKNGVEITYERDRHHKCLAVRQTCHSCWIPVRSKYNSLPENPSQLQRLKYALLCPPHGKVAHYIQLVILFCVAWATLISLTQDEALPGGHFFSLLVLFFSAVIGGYIVSLFRLPPLLGMLIIGCLLKNIPIVKMIGDNLNQQWSSVLRQVALTVILIRAGLGLDPKALRKLSWAVLRLAFSPCLAECIIEAIAAHFLLGLPWIWGLMLGFVLAAVSPAVVVPSLLSLADRGYGVDKGIPTLVIAAASVDDVIAITGFGVMLGIAFSTGGLAWSIVKGPLEAVCGVFYGIIVGLIIWYLPSKDSGHVTFYRILLLFGFGFTATFGSDLITLPGAGPLGCLTMAFMAAFKWRKDADGNGENAVSDIVAVMWMIMQPLLFGLIGSAVDVSTVDGSTVGLGLATLFISLVFRLIVSFLAVFGTPLNLKEKLFIPFAWMPKATVQAAIGALAYDKAIEFKRSDEIVYGRQILTIAVLSILVTAPIGAAIISILGPRLLHKTETKVTEPLRLEESVDEERGFLLKEREVKDETSHFPSHEKECN
ncbi:hypothetical protein CHS0354_005945 [Potamilus streckersoni]|uniref:Cation/H+ exchanger transmembrane domain-containing protein n=1 Tax=Potamilus streckersoni TaxID=2493646 RepID=A0AAE0VZF3_9BIVA|nr:hypothetical protein CHS0354_005945 [Potamilus streckersoni]